VIVIHYWEDFFREDRIQRYEEGGHDSGNRPDQAEVNFSVSAHDESAYYDGETQHGFAGCGDAEEDS